MNTVEKGEVAEAKVISRMTELGLQVCVPFGHNRRYDLVVDTGDSLERVQVKTGHMNDGAIQFDVHSSRPRGTGHSKEDYHGDVEGFAVYSPEMENVYYVPVEETGSSHKRLRVDEPGNGQTEGITWAEDYEIENGEPL